ncbi:hypothetical protein MauCBS54593_001178 [Microsporum audouinii]
MSTSPSPYALLAGRLNFQDNDLYYVSRGPANTANLDGSSDHPMFDALRHNGKPKIQNRKDLIFMSALSDFTAIHVSWNEYRHASLQCLSEITVTLSSPEDKAARSLMGKWIPLVHLAKGRFQLLALGPQPKRTTTAWNAVHSQPRNWYGAPRVRIVDLILIIREGSNTHRLTTCISQIDASLSGHYLRAGDKIVEEIADTSVGYQRQSTQFMGASALTRFRPSFPQPDDVEAEDEDSQTLQEPVGNDRTAGESSGGGRVDPRIIKSIDVAREVQRQDEDAEDVAHYGLSHPNIKRIQGQSRPRNSPIATNSSPVVRMSSDDNVPEAYFTAPDIETQSTRPEVDTLAGTKTKSQELRNPEGGEFPSSSSLPYRNSYATTTGASAISTADGAVVGIDTGSQSSLISHNKQPSATSGRRRKIKTQSQELQPQEPRGEIDQTEAELANSQQDHGLIGRVISDRVRFGVEERLDHGQRRLQGHLGLSSDSRSSRRQKRQARQNGEVLRAEKMLVRIDVTAQTVPNFYNDNASLKIETRPVENWREYLVVCRQGYDEQTPYLLQFYKTRVIPQIQGTKMKKKYVHEVRLIQGQANVNLFSSLDKTVVVWHPTKTNGTRIFIMRARAAAHSVEWYTFIRKTLGWKQPSSLFVHAPDLGVSLVLQNPFVHLAKDKYDENEGSLNTMGEEQAVSTGIIRTCMESLSECAEWSQILDVWKRSEKVGLAWRRYDRIEWIQGGNEERMYGTMAMRTSHDLELRPKRHYPTYTAVESCEAPMEEPSPIEGFLILLTSQQGTHRRWGKDFSKRLYFYSEDQYLCFCKPTKASTPHAPKFPTVLNTHSSTASETIRGSPVMYEVDPYPVQDGKISWLCSGNNNKSYAKYRDQIAFAENRRNTNNLSQAEGYVNLCRVSEIKALSNIENMEHQNNNDNSGETRGQVRNSHVNGSFSGTASDNIFELILDDGMVVRFRAYNNRTRDAWICRMGQLATYWKSRTKADINTLKSVRQHNLERLDIDEEQESVIGQFAQKWEVARAEASPELFNVCGPSGCRAIKRSGHLYRKPRRRGSFSQCSVILVEGQLLIFQGSVRAFSGEQIPHIHQSRQTVLDLRDCYLYSGIITSSDLLYHSQTFNNNHPSHNSTPRIYLSDGWTSADEDTATTFVIWNSTRKVFFHGEEERAGKEKKRKWRHVSRLGTSGRSIVFKARSRAERDMWVLAIETEIDRLQQQEDMRIVPEK